MSLSFISEFYLASDPETPIKQHKFYLSSHHIGNLGELYSGTLIRHLGQHYQLYSNPNANPLSWSVHNTSFGVKVGRIMMQDRKQKSQAITGNIGEAIVIPGISSALGVSMNKLYFHRIKAHRMKCPDYRISLSSSDLTTLWHISTTTNIPDFPMEVKSCLGGDKYYPVEALEQLYEYWKECNNTSVEGYGIIVRANIKNSETNIKYFLFIKDSKFSMERFKKIINVKNLKNKSTGKKDRIVKAIGRLFK